MWRIIGPCNAPRAEACKKIKVLYSAPRLALKWMNAQDLEGSGSGLILENKNLFSHTDWGRERNSNPDGESLNLVLNLGLFSCKAGILTVVTARPWRLVATYQVVGHGVRRRVCYQCVRMQSDVAASHEKETGKKKKKKETQGVENETLALQGCYAA